MPTPRFSPWLRVFIFGAGAAIASVTLGLMVDAALSVSTTAAGREAQSGLGEYALWVSALSYPTVWIWLVFCRRTYDKRPVRALGLRAQNRGRALIGGSIAGVFAIAWLFGVLWLSGGVRFNGFSFDVAALNPLVIIGQLLLYATLFAAVGFMEEAMFRGYALHNIGAAVGLRTAIWLQAIGFAAIHLGNVGASGSDIALRTQWLDAWRAMPSLALIGAILALCWAKSGTLWYSIGFHAAWNFALGCVFSLPVSGLRTFRLFDIEAIGSSWLTGGSFGAEGSILLWPILGALWLVLRRLPDHPQALHDVRLLRQTAPQVLAADKTVMTPENEAENNQNSPRRSRFQTSMRAAREADEANIGEIPILGQLPRPDATAQPTAIDFSHDGKPLEKTAPEDFQFQPLPDAPSPDNVNDAPQVLAAPVENDAIVIDTPPTDVETEVAAPEVPSTETPESETPEPETPEPVRRRPTPRW